MRTLAQPTRANDMPTLQITQKQPTTATNLGISPRFSCFAAFVFVRYVCVCALPFVLTDHAHTRVEYCMSAVISFGAHISESSHRVCVQNIPRYPYFGHCCTYRRHCTGCAIKLCNQIIEFDVRTCMGGLHTYWRLRTPVWKKVENEDI